MRQGASIHELPRRVFLGNPWSAGRFLIRIRPGELGTSPSAVEYRRPFREGSDRNECTLWRAGARSSGLRPVGGTRGGRRSHGRAWVAEASRGTSEFRPSPGRVGVPLPTLMAYVVTFVELIGGILLIVGLLSRLAALLLTIDLVMAILLVKVNIGLLSPTDGSGVGAELELGLI